MGNNVDIQRSVAEMVHRLRPEIVAALQELVRIPSQTGAEGLAQQAVARLMRAHDLELDVWEPDIAELQPFAESVTLGGGFAGRPNVVGVCRGQGRGHSLILNGHVDTVEVGDPTAWSHVPLGGDVSHGRLYGRGACDMKAGFAANVAVVETLRAAGVRLERPLAVHGVIGEEDGGLGAFATLRRGHRAEAAVITEPTGGKLVVANAGALTFRIEVPGRSAHGSMRLSGRSAFEAFLPVHAALLALEADRNAEADPLFGDQSLPYALSIGRVSTGDWASSVPDRLVAEGRYGVLLGEEPQAARSAFEDSVTEASLKDEWLRDHRPVVTWPGGQFGSGRLDPEHPLVGEMSAAAFETGSPRPPLSADVYGSDLRLYSGIGGIPTLHYGPGDIRQAHAPLEHVEIADVVAVTRALVVLAMRRCGVAG
jgi:acetylornithine deacetylase